MRRVEGHALVARRGVPSTRYCYQTRRSVVHDLRMRLLAWENEASTWAASIPFPFVRNVMFQLSILISSLKLDGTQRGGKVWSLIAKRNLIPVC
jgi:hypothetical protein